MDTFVFAGPTIPASEAAEHLAADYLAPAAQGDIVRLVRQRPRAIGIIDGYFENVPAVWHKEILWAMENGIAVYGAASMGALRAAELESFGMIGVGRIFEWFRNGDIEDDDEVALLHADARLSYRPLTEPLVNVRITMERAAMLGIATPALTASIIAAARSLFYKERTYPNILERAGEPGVSREEIEALREWLPAGKVDQKKIDAIQMLDLMAQHRGNRAGPASVNFHVENTVYWDLSRRRAGTVRASTHLLEDEILDEVRLAGPPYLAFEREAEFKALAIDAATRRGLDPKAVLSPVHDRVRKLLGIRTDEDLAEWQRRNDISGEEFRQLVHEEATVRLVLATLRHETTNRRIGQLRLLNRYVHFRDRALDKKRVLALAGDGLDRPSQENLIAWYFQRMERPVPTDLTTYSITYGFASLDAFVSALEREYTYLHTRSGRDLRPDSAS